MISAIRPALDDAALYSRVAVHRSDFTLKLDALRDEVMDRYAEYSNACGLCAKSPRSESDGNILRDSWASLNAKEFGDVRPSVFATTGKLCFLCGGKAGEIDHYLPRSSFPEFSILALNLLPACRYCNNKKRSRYQKSGERLYFHPHFMRLPQKAFITVEVVIDATVRVIYDIDRTSQGDSYEVLRRQFDDLSLAERYREDAIDYIVEQLGAFYAYLNAGGATALKSYLQTEADSVAGTRGRNHWRAALLQSLANSDEFCSGGFSVLGPDCHLVE